MSNSDYIIPAADDDEAEERYKKFKEVDPFPKIRPALLNSADFIDYAVTTGMIFPFNPEVGIKPASYEVKLGGEVLYWDDKNKRQYRVDITDNETIKFGKNSITFVTVAARFRLPDYIALRFNLQIHHVHRGLLLGTGPLVDPGFNGKLMIPIHNLTENDYKVDKNEGLICIEFTKLSENTAWENNSTEYQRNGVYNPNKGEKDNKNFLDYINKHVPGGIVRSSILSTLSDTRKALDATRKALDATKDYLDQVKEKVNKYTNRFSIGAFIAAVVLVFTVFSLISDANKYVADAKNNYIKHMKESPDEVLLDINKEKFSEIRGFLVSFKELLDSNSKELPGIREELNNIKTQLDAANKKIRNLEKSFQPSNLGDEVSKDKGG